MCSSSGGGGDCLLSTYHPSLVIKYTTKHQECGGGASRSPAVFALSRLGNSAVRACVLGSGNTWNICDSVAI